MNKTQRAAIRAYTDALAAQYQADGIDNFRRDLCDKMGTGGQMEMVTLKTLIRTFDGLPSLAKPESDASRNMRYRLGDAIDSAHDKTRVAQHILASGFMKTWIANDNPEFPNKELARFITNMHRYMPPMTLVGNTRKLGNVDLTKSIEDNHHGTPVRNPAGVFVTHDAQGEAKLSILTSDHSCLIPISALAESWGARLKQASEAEFVRGEVWMSNDAQRRLARRKNVRDANNSLIHASADLTAFFSKVSVVPLSPKVIEAIDAAKEIIKPPKDLRLHAQPYIGGGFGSGAL